MKAIPKALAVGVVAFAVLFALGSAVAPDVSQDDDTDNTLGATVSSTPPTVTNYTITDASDVSQMHSQIDVGTTYYFNVTLQDPDGWGDMRWANIRIWFDGGGAELSFTQQTTGANYRIDLNYTNVAPLTSPALSEWSVTEGNMVYASGSSSIFTNVANENYTFKLAFTLNNQVRWGTDPTNQASGSYNDANSWNSEVRARDFESNVVSQSNSTNVYHEFGVFLFNNVTIASDWDAGTISPGASGTSAIVTVTHAANRNYRLSVWFDTTLTSGANTIAVTNINITAAGDANDAITSDTSFAGLGSGNRVYIHGSGASERAHNVSADSETTGVQFRVYVPFGTASGSYVATLTIRVETP